MKIVAKILAGDTPRLNPPAFIFKKCRLAADHNARVLESHGFDLNTAIKSQHPSQISYGSEFRSPDTLHALLFNHPLWPRLKLILDNGASFPLEDISDSTRSTDLIFHQERGNHKSLTKFTNFIDSIIIEDIERGFALPLPTDVLCKLKGASIAPLGCHKQTSIDELGMIIPKYRLTHDQSFPGPSGLSVNARVIKEMLPPIMSSHVLSRIIHYIVNTRLRHPKTKIFLSKIDLDSAYRRCSMSSRTSLESITIYDGLLLVALRLTFGGSPCPSLWGVISETIADVGNAILSNQYWDHNEIFDPISELIESPISLPEDIPFKQARSLSVDLPPNDIGYIDIYIDDNIGVTPDIGNNSTCLARAIPLAIRTLTRPIDPTDVIPRKDIISLKKLKAEGRLEETKKVLGWNLDTRRLTISLPSDKFLTWCKDIQKMLSSKKAGHKSLESTLGRLNHVAGIFNPMRHYLGRLYQALYRAGSNGGWTCLTSEELVDLETMIFFLNSAQAGLSMNNLVLRQPTLIYRSDASEFGIGGYNLTSGIAWRLELPVDCRLRSSLNSLEFIASLISIWIDFFHGVISYEDCILSQTDSTSALGWLCKSNFADKAEEAVQLSTARKLADIMLNSNSCLYSQWFPGDQNVIADSLSRDFHISDSQLTNLLQSHFPEQVPYGLTILPVPPEIVSWLTCLLRSQQLREPWSKAPTRSKFALGLDSFNTLDQLESTMTHSLMDSPKPNEPKFSAPLPTQSEKIDWVLQNLLKSSIRNQSDPPWTVFHRSLNWQTDPTQGSTGMDDLHSFYSNSFVFTAPSTPQPYPRWL